MNASNLGAFFSRYKRKPKYRKKDMLFYTPFGDVSLSDVMLALATMIGAFGGFPAAPQALTSFAQSPAAKWFLVWVLVYQGGGKQDITITTAATVVGYLAFFVVAPMLMRS